MDGVGKGNRVREGDTTQEHERAGNRRCASRGKDHKMASAEPDRAPLPYLDGETKSPSAWFLTLPELLVSAILAAILSAIVISGYAALVHKSKRQRLNNRASMPLHMGGRVRSSDGMALDMSPALFSAAHTGRLFYGSSITST
jgi:hypothetical protein